MTTRTILFDSPYLLGFEHTRDLIERAAKASAETYPPYNVQALDEGDGVRISLAVAGFKVDELDVTSQPNLLVVSGRKAEQGEHQYLHHGIASRAFEQRFNLAEHIVVKDARYEDGVLTIDLVREVPEALKPRRIEIATASGATSVGNVTTLEQSKVA